MQLRGMRCAVPAAARRAVPVVGGRSAAATSSTWGAMPEEQPQQPQQQQQQRCEQQQQHERAALGRQLREGARGMAAVAALPLASTSFSSGASGEIYFGLAKAVDVYLVVLTVRILLSWFRNINWGGEPFNTLRQLTDPFLSMFRGIVPAIGGIDLSPMLGFFLLNFLRGVLMGMAV